MFFKYKKVDHPVDKDQQLKLFEKKSDVIADEIKVIKILKHKPVETF